MVSRRGREMRASIMARKRFFQDQARQRFIRHSNKKAETRKSVVSRQSREMRATNMAGKRFFQDKTHQRFIRHSRLGENRPSCWLSTP